MEINLNWKKWNSIVWGHQLKIELFKTNAVSVFGISQNFKPVGVSSIGLTISLNL